MFKCLSVKLEKKEEENIFMIKLCLSDILFILSLKVYLFIIEMLKRERESFFFISQTNMILHSLLLICNQKYIIIIQKEREKCDQKETKKKNHPIFFSLSLFFSFIISKYINLLFKQYIFNVCSKTNYIYAFYYYCCMNRYII